MVTGGAVFAGEVDDAEVEEVPVLFGEEGFEVKFGLGDIFAVAEAPAFGAAVYVGVDGEGRLVEGLGHYY